ncbi:head-tail connector protein [Methylocystis parvus]|uniref:head-tail connector protein n=1 Tax=Methylocystis parvus TaxID=134 RepID=UPI003C72B365
MAGLWSLVTKSATPIVSLAEAKRQTNTVDFNDDDILLTAIVDAVTALLDLENGVIGRPLLSQSWQFTAPEPSPLAGNPYMRGHTPRTGFLLTRAPLQAVTKVEYLQNGAYVDFTASAVTRQVTKEATLIRVADGTAWPRYDVDEAAWRITARLGYGDNAADIPAAIRQAALLLVSHFYQNREATTGFGSNLQELPLGVAALLMPHRAPNT